MTTLVPGDLVTVRMDIEAEHSLWPDKNAAAYGESLFGNEAVTDDCEMGMVLAIDKLWWRHSPSHDTSKSVVETIWFALLLDSKTNKAGWCRASYLHKVSQ